MMENFNDSSDKALNDILREIQQQNELFAEVPMQPDILPGSDTRVIRYGDVDHFRDYNHHQGVNPEFQGTCGIVSCEDVLKQFGQTELSEEELVDFAVENDLCNVTRDKYKSGGTTVFNQRDILQLHDIPAHVEVMNNFEGLANYVEQGRGVIIEVNAGVLWNDAGAFDFGDANHAICVTGYARNAETGNIEGFYINDSGRGYPEDSGRFVSCDTLQGAFLDAGGMSVVTDMVH
jgi:hypothetical protein